MLKFINFLSLLKLSFGKRLAVIMRLSYRLIISTIDKFSTDDGILFMFEEIIPRIFKLLKLLKGIQAVRIECFLFILKVANIRCFILINCSEQEAIML